MSGDPARRYLEWNEAIGDHYFAPEFAGASVRIDFDDSILVHIARTIDTNVDEFTIAIAGLIRTDLPRSFALYEALPNDGVHFPSLGLLAAQVLVASRMGTFEGIDSTAFWLPFRRSYMNNAPLSQTAIEQLDSFWRAAAKYYSAGNLGKLMLQNDVLNVPLRGFRHVNLPLWQVLLRETDRGQLRGWCALNSDRLPTGGLELLNAFAANAALFNRTLAEKLQLALTQPSVGSALLPLLEEIRSEVFAEPSFEGSRRLRGRLRLTGRQARCYLQRRDHFGRWTDVSGSLDVTEIMTGVDQESYGVSWDGGERILFITSDRDVGSTRGMISHDASVVLLASRDDVALPAGEGWAPISLDPTLDGLQAVRGDVDAIRDSALIERFGCSFRRPGLLQLEGGLRSDKGYLWGAQPRIWVAAEPTLLTINGAASFVDVGGFVRVPPNLPTGCYTVCADNDVVKFAIVNADELQDSDDAEEIGLELGRNVMRTLSLTRENVPRKMLIGAQLWSSA